MSCFIKTVSWGENREKGENSNSARWRNSCPEGFLFLGVLEEGKVHGRQHPQNSPSSPSTVKLSLDRAGGLGGTHNAWGPLRP